MTPVEASATDLAEVIALWHACGLTRPWNDPAQDFALALATPTATVLTVRDGGAIVGTVMTGFDGHRGWLYYLAVAETARRRGVGRTLVAAAEAWLAARGAPKVQLMIRDTNVAAGDFYAALGFERQPVATWGRFLAADEGAGPA